MWDAYDLVHRNPEMAALAARGDPNMFRVAGMAPAGALAPGAPGGLGGGAGPLSSGAWALLAAGDLWSRPPSRWLKGLDGVRDAHVGVYAHEEVLRALLAPKWARKRPSAVLGARAAGDGGGGRNEPPPPLLAAFSRDVVEHGPAAGLTVVLAVARPLPLDAAVATWTSRLRAIARAESGLGREGWAAAAAAVAVPRPLPPAGEDKGKEKEDESRADKLQRLRVDELAEAEEALEGLASIFSGEALAEPRTRLLCASPAAGGGWFGAKAAPPPPAALRQGSRIFLTAAPGGTLLVQAAAPPLSDAPGARADAARPQSYLLGSVRSPLLCRALCAAAVGVGAGAAAPAPAMAVDPPLARRALASALLYANGVTSRDVLERLRRGAPDGALPPVALPPRGAGALWRFGGGGAAAEGGPPLLLDGLRRAVIQAKADAAVAAVQGAGSNATPALM